MTRRKRTQAGFTLIEIMVSLTLFSFAIAGVLAIAVSMAQGFREQRQVVQTESTARGALEYIADAVRMSSPALSDAEVQVSAAAPSPAGQPHLVVGEIEDTESGNNVNTGKCESGAIRIYDSAAGPDMLELVFASGGMVTSVGTGGWTVGGTTLPLTDTSNLAENDYVLVTDGSKGHVVKIAALGASSAIVNTPTCILNNPATYNRGELVIRVMRAKFYVGTFDGISPVLIMDPDGAGPAPEEPLADYVEDFQVAAGVDEDDDGTLESNEWGFSMGGPTSFTTTSSLPPGARDLRAVRISLVARATSSLPGTTPSYRRPTVENRVQASTLDTFRRRVLSVTIDVRNLGGSP